MKLPYILLAFVIAACAGPPGPLPVREPPIAYPPETRERLLRLALAEWAEWGCVTRGLPGPTLTVGCREPRAANPEGDPRNFSRVLAYWRAVPQEAEAVPPNRARYRRALAGAPGGEAGSGTGGGAGGEAGGDAGVGLWAEPFWSAAFISWLMAAAGVDRVEFAPDASHVAYLDHLDRVAAEFPALAPFLPTEAEGAAPAPGDLVCFDRSARGALPRWADRAAERGRFRPMHCDLVVATGPGVVEAVGGNVADAVTLTRLEADGAGRLRPGERRMIVWVQNRLGRIPPFGNPS